MSNTFSAEVQSIVGPVLSELGFTLDEVADDVDEGGRSASIVFYRSDDCRVQIYQSSREGSVNCMIAPLDAPNEFGPFDRSHKWQYLTRFTPAPEATLDELVKSVSFGVETDSDRLEWVKKRFLDYFQAARLGILQMYGNS